MSSQWRYVCTTHNPADLAYRGVRVESFLKNEMWVCGPPFLLQPKEAWPADPDDLGGCLETQKSRYLLLFLLNKRRMML